ncbi:hypothetical protein LPJ53_003132 [Coemansia erecta]|uniref:NmrA-like domain-containing protein n=1 Tax=Coemansia erecta TaxID=147472 RepID=A0A9W7Y1D6_9FUNG|nr:hypothetical protein LPJ53_003132 [Coemansia erecta]
MSSANKPTAPYKKIVVVGSSGTLASYFINAFKQAGNEFQVTLLTRPQSVNKLKQQVNNLPQFNIRPVDYNNETELTEALRNQEVLLSLLANEGLAQQPNVIRAAQKAQVKWIIPSEYGSDISRPALRKIPFFADKLKTRELLESNKQIPYTYILTGIFADTYVSPLFKWNLNTRNVIVPGDGNSKNSFTPRQDIAAYTLAILRRLDQYRNATVRVASHTLTTNEWVRQVERASGSKFKVQYESAEQIKEQIQKRKIKSNYDHAQVQDELALTLAEGESLISWGNNRLDSDKLPEVRPTPLDQIIIDSLEN